MRHNKENDSKAYMLYSFLSVMADMSVLTGFNPIQNRGFVLLRFVSGFTLALLRQLKLLYCHIVGCPGTRL